ncbi:MAG: neutral/alkaline non-lysosomal ceramidase N-terminal domain-containing protein [Actinomycetota bacterium]|nr:neutral/alkaline non-lysosomal ceramidase N-terminal domain-containing protein [Actinomycetota bacterium]
MTRRALSAALFLSVAVLSSVLAAFVAPGAGAQVRSKPKVVVKAGYGEADATWHVGAGAGQYTAKSPDQTELVAGGDVDPHGHSTTQHDSYGVHSRLSYRAIVVQDGQGDQVAFVKSDSYLAQDYLARRVGQILEAEGSAVSYDEIFHMASHNHSSPYYQSPSWGVWVFQDAFDLRAFEYHARQMAAAILEAEESLVPARMGATTVTHQLFKGMIARKDIGDDGTPVGYPDDFGDMGLSVLRFDDMSSPASPKPLATLINWGQHPEGLDDHDLITGDFVAPLERFVERATGAPLVFGQGDVGSAEAGPGRPDLVPAGIPKRWSHAGHAQAERGAFLLSEDVVKAWQQIGAGTALVPYSAGFDVEAGNAWVPGPLSHPYPSFGNCRTGAAAEGQPRAPGVPTCNGAGTHDKSSMMWENLRADGIPVPEHVSPPAFSGVEENLRLHLQAFKLGDVIFASCACEAQVDLILNFETRADEAQGNIWHGYDWTERLGCTQGATGSWTCKNPKNERQTITFSDARYRRMKAQIHNDAKGWDAPENAPFAESEPHDPAKILGNFTHEELPASLGYKLPIGVGHAGDYNGYTVSYREYMAYDHYRKALTAYGPHTADYMVTRLVRLAGELNGGPELPPEPHDVTAQVDEARQVAASTALGLASSNAYDAWTAALPDDAGPAEATDQPEDVTRFGATYFSWRGGSNAADNPVVRVERLVDGTWQTYADQSGEVQTMVEFPDGMDGLLNTYQGNEEWIWTAGFEAFDAFPVEIGSTPAGEYRFVVDGRIRQDGESVPYHFESASFQVKPWDGVEVSDLRAEPGAVSFTATSYYPETYGGSPFPYVRVERKDDVTGVPFCTTCSFRPWASSGAIVEAAVTVVRSTGAVEVVPAQLVDGRWVAPVELLPGDSAYVEAGAVVDEHGERNAARSATVTA